MEINSNLVNTYCISIQQKSYNIYYYVKLQTYKNKLDTAHELKKFKIQRGKDYISKLL